MKRHLLEASKAALFLYIIRLAGFYSVSLYLEYYPKEVGVDTSLSSLYQDESVVVEEEEEDVIVQKQIVKKIVKVPVYKKIENEILQTELTLDEKVKVERQVEKKFKASSSSSAPSEMLRLITSIQASQRQLTDISIQMNQKLTSLSTSLDEINTLETSFQKEQQTNNDNFTQNINVKTLLPNIVKVLENEAQEEDKATVTNIMSLAKYELKQLSKSVGNGKVDTKEVYKLFNDISNLMDTKKKFMDESKKEEIVKDEGDGTESEQEEEEEEDDGFARESDLMTLYNELEDRFQSRLDSFFTDDTTTNTLTSVASSLAAAHAESMNVKQSDQKKRILQTRIQKMEQIIDMMKQQQKQLKEEKEQANNGAISNTSENDSKLCVQQSDITYLVETGINALLTRKLSLEQVLTNSLHDLLEEYVEDFEEIETYKVTAPITTNEGPMMEDQELYRHESSSLLTDQENLRSLVDTAILPKIVTWMDIFIDTIAGYNDSLDTVIDFLAGDEKKGETFGKRFQSLLMKSFESIQLPNEIKELILEAGILTTQQKGSF